MRKMWLVAGILVWTVLQAGALAPDLEQVLTETRGPVPVYAVLLEQVDSKTLLAETRHMTKAEARRHVIQVLKTVARESQRDLLAYLKSQEQLGKARKIRPLWITNVVAFEATPEVIREVARRPEVAEVRYNPERQILRNVKPKPLPPAPAQSHTPADHTGTKAIAWGVNQINAPSVWAQGYTGQGVVVGVLDTGVNYNHVDLQDHMWTNNGEIPNNGVDDDGNGYVDDYYGYDFAYDDGDPMDGQGHGTHCAGTVAGDGTAGTQTGVAPDAQIMALKILNDYGGGNEADVWEGVQYALDNGADVLSASIGWCHRYNPDRRQWRQVGDNVLAAGVVWVAAAGNEGDLSDPWNSCPDAAPDNVATPGDIPSPWKHPDQASNGSNGSQSSVITVGATDSNDNIASFSSRGGSTWSGIVGYNDYPYVGTYGKRGLIKPDVSAPGVDITSLDYQSNTGYISGWDGTSMATPHVAGAVALMLSKNPGLSPRVVDSLLQTTAIELGLSGKDSAYGAGRIDALAAVNAVPLPSANHDVTVSQILEPSGVDTVTNSSSVSVTPTVRVKNLTDSTESFYVYFVMADPNGNRIYSAMTAVSNLAGHDSVDVTFPSHTFTYTSGAGTYYDTAWVALSTDENPTNDTLASSHQIRRQGTHYLIVDLDPNHSSGPVVDEQLQYWGWAGEYTTSFPTLSEMQSYDAVWIFLGVYSNNYQLTNAQANTLVDYLHTGGNLYMEGGDAWAYDDERVVYDPYFGIDPDNSQDGDGDISSLQGLNNSYLPWVAGHTWNYTGENSWMDRLVLHSNPPDNGSPAYYLQNPSTNYYHGVINQGTYNGNTYHTVAHAFELGSLVQTGKGAVAETLAAYIQRTTFGITPVVVQEEPPVHGAEVAPRLQVWPSVASQQVQVAFTLPDADRVRVVLYDATGRRIRTLYQGQTTAGTHTLTVSLHSLPQGVYLVRIQTRQGISQTHRFVLLR